MLRALERRRPRQSLSEMTTVPLYRRAGAHLSVPGRQGKGPLQTKRRRRSLLPGSDFCVRQRRTECRRVRGVSFLSTVTLLSIRNVCSFCRVVPCLTVDS